MHDAYEHDFTRMNCLVIPCPEYYDGVVELHCEMLPAGPHSEYLWIRRRPDPVPQDTAYLTIDFEKGSGV